MANLRCGAMLVLPVEVLSRSPGMGIFYTWYYVGMALLTSRWRDLSAISPVTLVRP